MHARILGGSAGAALGERIAAHLGEPPLERLLERFPDGELHAQLLSPAAGLNIFVVQPVLPAGDALLELLLLADAARRAGAKQVVAVVPYLAYARQDRRAADGEALAAAVVLSAIGRAADGVLAVDLHHPALEGVCPVPLWHLTAAGVLAEAVKKYAVDGSVVVSPDLGGMKRAEHLASLLGRPSAVVHKTRLGPSRVATRAVVGEVKGLLPIVVDDLISTGSTVVEAVAALRKAGARRETLIAATHGVFGGPAAERLAALDARVVVTDTVIPRGAGALSVERVSVAGLLAEAIWRIDDGRALAELVAHQ